MIQLDFRDHSPIYEQIKEKMKFLIIEGVLKEGDRVPSVRELAMSMAINPNTIQRAYKELESEGYIYSQKAKGYFVSPHSETEKSDSSEIMSRFIDSARELMYLGKTEAELCDILKKIYNGGNCNGND